MSSMITEYNQENLVEIPRLDFWDMEEVVSGNYLLDMTRGSYYSADKAVTIRKRGDEVLLVSHCIRNPKGVGIIRKYKADKNLYDAYLIKREELDR